VYFFHLKLNFFESGFCPRLQMESTQLGQIELIYVSEEQVPSGDKDRIQPLKRCILDKHRTVDNLENCDNYKKELCL
jgi:hypothetical protein